MLVKSREREKAPSQGQDRKGAHDRENKASAHNTGAKHPWPFLIHCGGLGLQTLGTQGFVGKTLCICAVYI